MEDLWDNLEQSKGTTNMPHKKLLQEVTLFVAMCLVQSSMLIHWQMWPGVFITSTWKQGESLERVIIISISLHLVILLTCWKTNQ